MASKKPATYQELSEELNAIMGRLQTEEIDIEEAVKTYKRGVTIVKELEKQLKTAENKVKKIKLQFE